MKITKKIAALLLAIAMVGCFFAGCKPNNTDTPDAGTPTPEETQTVTPPDETPTVTPPVETPTPPVGPLYTFEKANVNEDAKTCYVGAIVIDRELCPIDNENEEIKEIVIPSELDGYKVIGIAWDVMGQKGGGQGFLIDPNNNDSIRCSATKVVIPATVETIEYGAFFFGSDKITEVVFEDASNIKRIQDYAFLGTKWVETEADNNDGFVVINGILVHAAVTGDDMITLPSNVKVVTESLWRVEVDLTEDCGDYKAIIVNDGCEEIKSKAFNMHDGDSAWWVRIPESVTKIANNAIDDGFEDKIARVCVKKGSYAETWAKENDYAVVYEVTKGSADETWALENRYEFVYPNEKYSLIVCGSGYGVKEPVDTVNKTVGVSVMINRNLVSFEETAKEVKEIIVPEKIGDYTVTGVGGDFRGERCWGGVVGFDVNLGMGPKYYNDRSKGDMDLQSNLTRVELPATIREIGYAMLAAIYGRDLTEVVFKGTDNITSIGKTPFKSTMWEVEAAEDRDDGILVLGKWAVYVMSGLDEIIFPNGVEIICAEVCHDNDNAQNDYSTVGVIKINDGCKTIESGAFSKCKNVTDIYIPDTVTSIGGNGLFGDWDKNENKVTSSTKVHVVKGSYADTWATSKGYTVEYYTVDRGYTFTKEYVNEEAKTCWAGAIIIDRDRFPIDNENEEITEMYIPDYIDDYKVTGLAWDLMGQRGGGQGFMMDPSDNDSFMCFVKTVYVPATVETIQYGAFSFGSGSIENIVFEDISKITKFEVYPFSGTKWIKNIAKANDGCAVINGILLYCDPRTNMGDVVVPDNVVEINARLFVMMFEDGCDDQVATFTVNEGCKKIGNKLFEGQKKNVEWIYIPASVESIGSMGFKAEDNPDFVVKTVKGSYADTWAQEQGFKVEYAE